MKKVCIDLSAKNGFKFINHEHPNLVALFCLDEEDDDDQDIPAYGFPRNRREPSDIDFIISNAGSYKWNLIINPKGY